MLRLIFKISILIVDLSINTVLYSKFYFILDRCEINYKLIDYSCIRILWILLFVERLSFNSTGFQFL